MVRGLPECLGLCRRQPVAEPYAQFLYTLDSPYPSSQVRAEESTVRCLVCKTANSPQTKVDKCRERDLAIPDAFGTGRRPSC
jgi:hypothetical protein